MVNKTEIVRNLRSLNYHYNRKPRTVRDPLYFSKLSLLELCGWIEVTMDGIVGDCGKKHLKVSGNRKFLTDTVIRRTYGFSYEGHFRQMLMRVIGLVKVGRT